MLTNNVPFRLQAPFLPDFKGREWDCRKEELTERINRSNLRGLYYFGIYNGLHTTIEMNTEWFNYIRNEQEILRGWIQYKMIEYLQRRNPSVPGIIDKLFPPQERNLERVKKYWKMLLELQSIREIYGQTKLTDKNISIDHFVPWSYVAHDELWNLHPTTRSINSSKSSCLPDWEKYFPLLCRQEYFSYQMMWQHEKVHCEFEKCAQEHLNNEQIRRRLYIPGLEKEEFGARLAEVIWPVYQSAKNSGFGNWVYAANCRKRS